MLSYYNFIRLDIFYVAKNYQFQELIDPMIF